MAERVERVDPDVVQIYRNVRDDTYVSSGLADWVASRDLGAVFCSPLRHGLLTGKYTEATVFPEGDFRRNVHGFGEPAVLAEIARAAQAIRDRFTDHPEPILHALLGAILDDAPTGCAIVGLRNPQQVRAVATAGDILSSEDRDWVRGLYEGVTLA